jgi:transcriptional regulator with XRE-family HTH domain
LDKPITHIGMAIKEIRVSKGVTNKVLARKLDVTPSALSKYESNDRKLKAEMLPVVADALGVTVDFILQKMLTIRQHEKSA